MVNYPKRFGCKKCFHAISFDFTKEFLQFKNNHLAQNYTQNKIHYWQQLLHSFNHFKRSA